MVENREVYASLATRIKAGIIDGLVLITLFITIPYMMGAMAAGESPIKAMAMYAPLLLLEPILVTFLGATLGQLMFGMKVVRIESGTKCPLYLSFIRYVFKALFGSVSLVYMLFSRKHQAIHDHIAKTIVVISGKKLEKNPQLEKYGEVEQLPDNEYAYPSAIRRFIFFIIWYVLISIVLGIAVEAAALMTMQGYTVGENLPELVEGLFRIIMAVVFITLAVFASKGFLPGARRKKIAD